MRNASANSYHVKFDAFLYAVILEEQSGVSLTVLSLLARHDLDPWEEAAKYARSPRGEAVTSLSDLLAGVIPYSFMDERVCTEALRLLSMLPPPDSAHPVTQNPMWPVIVDLLKRLKDISGILTGNDRR
jgi:hypothetical protein